MNIQYSDHIGVLDKENKDKTFNIDQTKVDSFEKTLLCTHAHSDHIVNSLQNIFTSSPTKDFINIQLPNNKLIFSEIKTNRNVCLTDRLSLVSFNAGHVLGSNMFYFETNESSLLYTGDFQTQNSLLLKGAVPVESDILVIESTFGREEFNFPNKEKIYIKFAEDIARDIINNRLIIIGAYKLGKSQEMIKFVNKYLKETPLVSESIFNNSKIYEKFDLNLGKYELLNGNLNNHNILIIPPNLINNDLIHTLEHQTTKKISTYFVTGWKFYKRGKCIPISDHCDFNDLINFVSLVKPKTIITMHGFYNDFAKSLKKHFKNTHIKTIDKL
jgi:Cft2 family RNA processing exonuclease